MTDMGSTSTLKIRTPEGVAFSLHLAGPITRFLAWIIDFAVIAVLTGFANGLLGFLGLFSMDLASAASMVAFFLISVGYGIILEWRWRGQTVGKRLLDLRVMDSQGLKLQFNQVAVRNLLRFVDSLPLFYLVGGLVCVTSRHFQRIGDLAGNTIVVRHPRVMEPDLEQIMGGKYNSFRQYPHLEARLRKRVPPEEAQVGLQALLRRDALDPVARLDLFETLAAHFMAIVPFPAEATRGLSDEQVVRNMVDVLFRSPSGRTAAV